MKNSVLGGILDENLKIPLNFHNFGRGFPVPLFLVVFPPCGSHPSAQSLPYSIFHPPLKFKTKRHPLVNLFLIQTHQSSSLPLWSTIIMEIYDISKVCEGPRP
jgi:hypothetical protein